MKKSINVVLIVILSALAAGLIAAMCVGINTDVFSKFKNKIHINLKPYVQISEQTVLEEDIYHQVV